MVANMKFALTLAEDRQSVTITMLMNDTPLGHAIVEAPELEELVQLLAAHRASMAEEVPTEIEPLAMLTAVADPMWRTKIPSSSPVPGVVLALRHPGLGWLANLLPRREAEALGQSLLDLSREPLP
jgi:hypothetical protein